MALLVVVSVTAWLVLFTMCTLCVHGSPAPTKTLVAADGSRAGSEGLADEDSVGRPSEAILRPQDMMDDLAYVTSIVEQVHPAMDGRSPEGFSLRDRFAALVKAAEIELHEPLPAWRFFAIVNAVLAFLGDAHTSLWLPDSVGTLPVQFTWAEDGVVVSRVLDPAIPVRPGDELVSLGGHTPERLLEDLGTWIPHSNPYWVKALASRYLANPLVLRGLGLPSGHGSTREQAVSERGQAVEVVVRRPSARCSAWWQSPASAPSNLGALPPQRLQQPAAPSGALESKPPESEGPALEEGSGGEPGTSDVVVAEVPIWDALTVSGLAATSDPKTGRASSPAAEAGVRPGDRVFAADGSPVRSVGDLARAVQECGREGRELALEVLRNGERLEFTMRPVPGSAQAAGAMGSAETTYVIGVVLGGVPSQQAGARSWFGWTIDRSAGYGLFWLDKCDNTREYRQAVDAFFTAVRRDGIMRIAVDLRRNTGGDSMVVGAFLKYLPYTYSILRAPSHSTRRSSQLAEQRSLGLRLLMWIGETFFNGRWLPYPIQPRASADELFRGEVYVLTSWLSFSSAVDFAAILRDNHLAKVVGAPTGAAPTQYGDTLVFTMPHTGWRFSVSTTWFVRPDPSCDPADAIYPDIPIAATIQDIREGRDPVLEWLGTIQSVDGEKTDTR